MVNDECIFCKIANGCISSTTVYEDNLFRVILDLAPANIGHALILPKNHYTDLTELGEAEAEKVLLVAKKIGKTMKKSLNCEGFNIVQNNGEAAGQTVFHFHTHIIPRYKSDKSMLYWDGKTVTKEELEDVGKMIVNSL
jgi:Diadenosine tetraphosphate (Ap4A) hydrolase and other HIT family hydrolases